MTGAAGGFQVEAGNGIAAGDHAAIGPGRLGHQHIFVAGGLGLDQVAGRRTADFLVTGEQDGDGQPGRDAGALQLADGFQRHVVAALHVLDTRPPGLVAFAAERQFLQGPDRVDGVQVAHDQDARRMRRRVRKGGTDAVAIAHPTGDPLDPRTGQHQRAGRHVHHAVHGRRVERRAFAFHPFAQSGDHGFGIEGQRVRIHALALLGWRVIV